MYISSQILDEGKFGGFVKKQKMPVLVSIQYFYYIFSRGII